MFPFVPSTTSHLVFQASFTSSTHPSLPATATAQRNIVRSALKTHKRLSVQDQASNLHNLTSSLSNYLKYLLSIDLALAGQTVTGEEVDITLTKDIEVEWRPTLASSSIPGREVDRVKGRGLDYEIYFVHHTYALIQTLLARQSLLGLYNPTVPTPEQRLLCIQAATKYLKSAYAIHTYLSQRSTSSQDGPPTFPSLAIDISPSTQSALQRLSKAHFNLLCVLKDDPYPALLTQSRNKSDREWMIKAPTIPKVRAQVLTRLCIGAADHAAAALASLTHSSDAISDSLSSHNSRSRISKDLIDHVADCRRTARARACRFQALDSDLAGQTGKAIAWLHAALHELGIDPPAPESSDRYSGSQNDSPGGFRAKLKSTLTSSSSPASSPKKLTSNKYLDATTPKAAMRWGLDSGRAEEVQIVKYLLTKFNRVNDTVNVQVVPEWRAVVAMLPSGMNMPLTSSPSAEGNGGGLGFGEEGRWVVDDRSGLLLSEDELSSMRAPLEGGVGGMGLGDSSGDEEEGEEDGGHGKRRERRQAPGAFPVGQDDGLATTSYY